MVNEADRQTCKTISTKDNNMDKEEVIINQQQEHSKSQAVMEWLLEPGRFKLKPETEEHTSELQSHHDLVCRLLLEKKNKKTQTQKKKNKTT